MTGICAITLAFGVAGRASASPPLGEDVAGAAAITLTMGVAATGAVVAPVTGASAITLDLAVEGHGLAFAPVTGTSAITLDLGVSALGEAYAIPGVVGNAAIPLTLGVAAVGTHIPLVTGAASIVLPLGVAAAGTFQPMVVGTSAITLAMVVAAVGTVSSSAPDSIANPVAGTDLSDVYALRLGGTGPRSGPTNGTYGGGAPDAYLISKGFSLVGGQLIQTIGSSTVNVANYDFAGADVRVFGPGTANYTDCSSTGYGKGIVASCDANGSIISTGNTQIVNLNYCDFNGSNTWLGSGYLNHNYCRVRNQKQFISSSSFSATGAPHMTFDWCYITGGGVEPATSSHVELSQSNPADAAGAGTFSVTNCLVILSDGQATAAPWGSAWTGIWSVGKQASVTIANSIHIGIAAVNANPLQPYPVVNCTLAYLVDTADITLTNSVWEAGRYGYTLNQNGANRPTDGGGNRTFANAALTAADFG